MKHNSAQAELLSRVKLIIWDEVPMVHRFFFEALDRKLRDILRFSNPKSFEQPFCGKVIVLGGDFRHILHVIPHGGRQEIIKIFSEWLLYVDDDNVGDNVDGFSIIKIPDEILINDSNDPLSDLVEFAYPNLLKNMDNSYFFEEYVIFAPTLANVCMLHKYLMSIILCEEKIDVQKGSASHASEEYKSIKRVVQVQNLVNMLLKEKFFQAIT
ncbi:uncharacterized protein LOC133307665 [Gastrolobium bilobum]|uniref:uncharacterized protein LOC133307665 n=1 Tax=Gastrolobium bilobum TaxID=150636 RepID=UPI002AB1ECC3|nr:uncharacterized protein LOC133307665 [Gastrolobium bilobum]